MQTFYKIEEGRLQVGSGKVPDDSWTIYEVGQEPIELTEALNKENAIQDLTRRIAEAKQYLSETSWIWEKYNRNVTVLGDLTNDEFKLKYADIIALQEEARVLINTLELELKGAI